MTEHAGGPAGMINYRREVVELTVHVEGLVVVPALAPAPAVVGDSGHLRSQRGGQRCHRRTVVEGAPDEYDRHAGGASSTSNPEIAGTAIGTGDFLVISMAG
jgi:hypothetical protein